jgi:hypothetical protein
MAGAKGGKGKAVTNKARVEAVLALLLCCWSDVRVSLLVPRSARVARCTRMSVVR